MVMLMSRVIWFNNYVYATCQWNLQWKLYQHSLAATVLFLHVANTRWMVIKITWTLVWENGETTHSKWTDMAADGRYWCVHGGLVGLVVTWVGGECMKYTRTQYLPTMCKNQLDTTLMYTNADMPECEYYWHPPHTRQAHVKAIPTAQHKLSHERSNLTRCGLIIHECRRRRFVGYETCELMSLLIGLSC